MSTFVPFVCFVVRPYCRPIEMLKTTPDTLGSSGLRTKAKEKTTLTRNCYNDAEKLFEFMRPLSGNRNTGIIVEWLSSGLWEASRLSPCWVTCAGKRRRKCLYAKQLRLIDVVSFERYVSAVSENNRQLSDFLVQRFRPASLNPRSTHGSP